MSLPLDHPSLRLSVLPGQFFVFKHEIGEPIPAVVIDLLTKDTRKVLSVTKTHEEFSIAGEWQEGLPESYEAAKNWRCIAIAGPMEFSLTGVVNAFTRPLQAAKVPVFVISTWNTDYILVNDQKLENAVDALRSDGWKFNE